MAARTRLRIAKFSTDEVAFEEAVFRWKSSATSKKHHSCLRKIGNGWHSHYVLRCAMLTLKMGRLLDYEPNAHVLGTTGAPFLLFCVSSALSELMMNSM